MQETWVIPGLGKSPGEGTHFIWPGEFHGLYIVHGVTKIPTQLSDFHFHFDIWPLAGWLKKQKMITPVYLVPGQVKARWDWKEGGGMACLLWEHRHWEGGVAKGPHVKTPADTQMGQGRAPWSQSRSRSDVRGGDPASLLFVTRRGVLKETHPPRLVIKRWLEDSNSSPATLSRANPRGKVEKLSGQTKNQVAWDPPLKGLGSLTIGNKWQ